MTAPPFQLRYDLASPASSPPWLLKEDGNAKRYLYGLGLPFDSLLQKMFDAMRAKCPGLADASAIPFQAADRRLVQGPAESNEPFVLRLKGAFDAWGIVGSRKAVANQLQAYMTGLQPGVATSLPVFTIVGGNLDLTTWDTVYGYMAQGDQPAHSTVTPANWDWDGELKPWRAWLILYMHLVETGLTGAAGRVTATGGSGVTGVTSGFATMTGIGGVTDDDVQRYITVTGAASAANNGTFQIVANLGDGRTITIANPDAVAPDANNFSINWTIGEYPYIGPAPVWGSPDAVWGDDNTWGVNCSPEVIESIRNIVKRWKSGTTYYPNIIISFGGADGTAGSEFSALSSQGAGNPDGTWTNWGKNVDGVWVPSKETLNPFTSFCDGTARAIRCYEKNQG